VLKTRARNESKTSGNRKVHHWPIMSSLWDYRGTVYTL
jgi:hypothetical protein